jgi:hypothetical protein
MYQYGLAARPINIKNCAPTAAAAIVHFLQLMLRIFALRSLVIYCALKILHERAEIINSACHCADIHEI